MKNTLKSTKTTIVCCIIIGLLLIGLSVYAVLQDAEGGLLSGKEVPSRQTGTPVPTQVELPSQGDTTAEMLVLAADAGTGRLQVYSPAEDRCFELIYNGTTDIRDRFGSVIAATQIERAAIAELSYDAETGVLYSVHMTGPDWYHENQGSVEFNVEKGRLTVAGNHYRCGENIIILEDGVRIARSDLAAVDELNVMGMGERVFLIERVKGHGVLQLKNAAAFLGGTFYIDGKKAETVTGDMSLTMREGEYRFTLEKEEVYAEKTLIIQNGEIQQWDLTEFLPKEPEYGRVEFLLEPDGVDLYIDNQLCKNTAFAELEYGEHVIGVYKNGYVSWTGKITVSSDEMVFSVSLVPEPTPTPTPLLTPTPIPTEVPVPTVSPTPEQEETKEVQLVWYPDSVVCVDSVYVGNTDAAGVLVLELRYGTHVFELTRILLDGNTVPAKYTAGVNAQTTILNFLVSD